MRRPLSLGLAVGASAALSIVLAVPLIGPTDGAGAQDTESPSEPTSSETASSEPSDATARVASLSEEVKVNGLVGFGETFALPIEAQGTVTWAPADGTVLGHGDTVVSIDNRPIVMLRSDTPIYRNLRLVASGEKDSAGRKLGRMEGDDVLTLQKYLLSLGFDDKGRMEADGVFGVSTKRAVKAWQADVGYPATGTIDRSQMIFGDSDVRVNTKLKVGLAFEALSVTEPSSEVTATITSKQKSFFPVGGTVAIDADGTSLEGVITEVKREAAADGSTSFTVHMDVANLPDGAEATKVVATKVVVADALTVPVSALLALVEGGWAVEVITPTGTELTAVELIDVVDTLAAVTGINEGDRVVIPS